ncbi:hypothetical protein M426DRAFT_170012 [Hypoxylon sp. CI-4A]|nr:hypothetical protein M426DRAFT_170012 [Hypoxylon sp. CI-4A]
MGEQLETRVGGYDPDFVYQSKYLQPSYRPVSPFAKKYGVSQKIRYARNNPDGRAHSGHAPMLPPYTSTNRGPIVDYLNPQKIPRPSNEELDQMFMSEQSQRFDAGETWRSRSMKTFLWEEYWEDESKSNSEHWKDYKKKLFQVDEKQWFSFLRKDCWFDCRRDPLTTLEEPVPGFADGYPPHKDYTYWSVDNPVVWDELRFSIELVFRILRQLCTDRDEW